MPETSRRRFLASCALAGITGIAGCSGELSREKTEINAEYPPKEISGGLWESQDKSAIPFRREGLSGVGAVRTYENTRISKVVQKRFAGQFSRSLAMGFAINLKYEGLGSTLVTAQNLHKKTKPEVFNRLRNRGLSGFRELSRAASNDPKPKTKWNKGEEYSEFSATYVAPKKRVSFELEEYGEQTLTFPEEKVQMRILYFVRDLTHVGTDGTAFVLGGVYPDSNYRNQATTVLKEEGGRKISLNINLNTGLNIQHVREDLVNEFINELLAHGL